MMMMMINTVSMFLKETIKVRFFHSKLISR